jgi:MFS family permease
MRYRLGGSTEQRLLLFFGVAYFAQGLAGGLAKQPVTYYLKSLGLTADAVAACLALAATPWMIKPLYGLLTDFIPLFGYRRKSYLLLMAGLAVVGCAIVWQSVSIETLVCALAVTTLGIAATDVVVDALMVEEGQRRGLIRQFQGQQWVWLNLAAIATALLGGWLSHAYLPITAVHTAALLMVTAPAAVILAGWLLVDERRVPFDRSDVRRRAGYLLGALRSRPLWMVAAFIAFWNLVPNFSTPLYYHMVDHLRFDQYFIGQLVSVGSVGALLGALIYQRGLSDRCSTQGLLALSITISSVMAFGFLFLRDRPSAILLSFAAGTVGMISLLTLFTLAASVCSPQAAGFTFAAMMAIHSITTQISALFGGVLYERWFAHQIAPLIILAALCTLAAFLWVPLLPAEGEGRPRAEADRAYVS